MEHSQVTSSESEESLHIALSGGGFRATLFHLGVILSIIKAGRFSKHSTLVGVSGGAAIAALIGIRRQLLSRDNVFPNNIQKDFCFRLLELTKRDLRNNVLSRWFGFWLFLLTFVFVWMWVGLGLHFRIFDPGWWLFCVPITASLYFLFACTSGSIAPTRSRLLIKEYQSVFGKAPIQEMDNCYLTGTSLSSGAMILIGSDKLVECFRPGLAPSDRKQDESNLHGLLVAKAVAMSSAFPPAFPPFEVKIGEPGNRHRVTDGGVFDNSGIFALRLVIGEKETALVSDAGRPLLGDFDRTYSGALSRNSRASDLMMYTVAQQDADGQAKYVRIRALDEPTLRPESGDDDFQRKVSGIRTDLNAFSDAEIASLVWHGSHSVAKLLGIEPLDETELTNCFGFQKNITSLRNDFLIGKSGESLTVSFLRFCSLPLKFHATIAPVMFVFLSIALFPVFRTRSLSGSLEKASGINDNVEDSVQESAKSRLRSEFGAILSDAKGDAAEVLVQSREVDFVRLVEFLEKFGQDYSVNLVNCTLVGDPSLIECKRMVGIELNAITATKKMSSVSFARMPSLKRVSICDCDDVLSVSGSQSLEEFRALRCSRITSIDLSMASKLTQLEICIVHGLAECSLELPLESMLDELDVSSQLRKVQEDAFPPTDFKIEAIAKINLGNINHQHQLEVVRIRQVDLESTAFPPISLKTLEVQGIGSTNLLRNLQGVVAISKIYASNNDPMVESFLRSLANVKKGWYQDGVYSR